MGRHKKRPTVSGRASVARVRLEPLARFNRLVQLARLDSVKFAKVVPDIPDLVNQRNRCKQHADNANADAAPKISPEFGL